MMNSMRTLYYTCRSSLHNDKYVSAYLACLSSFLRQVKPLLREGRHRVLSKGVDPHGSAPAVTWMQGQRRCKCNSIFAYSDFFADGVQSPFFPLSNLFLAITDSCLAVKPQLNLINNVVSAPFIQSCFNFSFKSGV